MPRPTIPAGYSVEILLDSINTSGNRLLSWKLTYPRFVHAEFLRHRVLSRDSASSRAIPVERMHDNIRAQPALPVWWGKNQPGMAAKEEVADKDAARDWWLRGRDMMLAHAAEGVRLGLHKQLVNRVTEPWMLITEIVTGTDWQNFFLLRDHPDAQPELQAVATEMHYQFHDHSPVLLQDGEWHRPFARPEDYQDIDMLARELKIPRGNALWERQYCENRILNMLSVGRCARVSYLNHDGKRAPMDDIRLHNRLLAHAEPCDPTIDGFIYRASGDEPVHLSPLESVAMALPNSRRVGNFTGWMQYRKYVDGERGPEQG